ncbi:hypothetical protein JRQ81_001417 [Phrynocephalus forsythii]|uniref:Reverse transcriptase n=1 Tax=Phrynocephalus forsythii TaxID=171643 RepID=A0A9Q1B8D7_9SAUR|nr:hypothetical protein JRQ81_001417 [Phrynocephalus forsythii]
MRVSKDKLINHAGHLLANFSITRSLLWLNGLADLNFDGEFTYISPHGARVIDYILIPAPLLSIVLGFMVIPLDPSDHLPILCSLAVQTALPESSIMLPRSLSTPSRTVKVKWDLATKTLFEKFLQSNPPLGAFTVSVTDSPLACIERYEQFVETLTVYIGRPFSTSAPHQSRAVPEGLNMACLNLKKELRQIYHIFIKSNNSFPPHRYFIVKQQLAEAIKHGVAQVVEQSFLQP